MGILEGAMSYCLYEYIANNHIKIVNLAGTLPMVTHENSNLNSQYKNKSPQDTTHYTLS